MKLRILLLPAAALALAACGPKPDSQAPVAATPPASTPAAPTEPTAPATETAPKSPADLAYEAAWAHYRTEMPEELKSSPRESFRWNDQKFQEFAKAVRAFGEKYPEDPRRYEGWVQSSYTGPSFIVDFKPDFDARPSWSGLISDEQAVLKYRSEQVRLLEQVLLADDATTRQRAGAFNAYVVDSGTVARIKGEKFDVRSVRPLVDRIVAKFGDERVLPVVQQYAQRLRAMSAPEADEFMASLAAHPTVAAAMQRVEAERVAAEAERTKKLTALAAMKFTAVDGREVDLGKLKGKVVLIDFWATWCGPCIAELPNVKKVYQEFHDQGFEIIGITLENARLAKNDTPAQAAEKLAKAKKVLTDFTAKNEMPWPQFFDGTFWQNEYVQQFGIEGIPAMFLLDKNGQVASTEARGEKLASEVKRLLAL